jgi:hypothetical protein
MQHIRSRIDKEGNSATSFFIKDLKTLNSDAGSGEFEAVGDHNIILGIFGGKRDVVGLLYGQTTHGRVAEDEEEGAGEFIESNVWNERGGDV